MLRSPKYAFMTAAAVLALGGAALAQGPMGHTGHMSHAGQMGRMSRMDRGSIAAAVADPNRPAADVARDAARKPAQMLEFAAVRPGETVVDFMPGGGYFTRIFAKAVGPSGHVYAVTFGPESPDKPPPVAAIAADPAYGNITVLHADQNDLHLPVKADLIWTSQNYHDLHLARLHVDMAAMDKAFYDALKPGGLFVVLDHAAAPGTGLEVPDQLHRINPQIVRREVQAAGFRFVGQSDVLRNGADNHLLKVFDPAIRGHTDQFIYKFRKPR